MIYYLNIFFAMGFLFTQFESLKHFRQYLAGEITHSSAWAAQKTGNYNYSKHGINDVFTKEIYVSEEKARRKKYFDNLNKYSSTPISYESGEYGDYRLYFKLDLRNIMLGDLPDLKKVSQFDSAYKVVLKRVIEQPEFRCGAQDNGERHYFSHLTLDLALQIDVENAEGITNPKPDLFPYKEVATVIEVDGEPTIEAKTLTEKECNLFVRNIMKREVALFIQEVYDLKKPKNKS